MGVNKLWFDRMGHALWRTHKSDSRSEKAMIGVLTFEVASLMSKVVNLWDSLTDSNVARLREDILYSEGIRRLVSEDADYLIELAFSESVDNFETLIVSVARLGRKCTDNILQKLPNIFDDLIKNDRDLCRWKCSLKEMEKKVKKMEKFISASAGLYQEIEVLTELEQSLARMRSDPDQNWENLLKFQQKVDWERSEVKYLYQASLWNYTYDYAVSLLAKSLFTIHERIKDVFGIQLMCSVGGPRVDTVGNNQSHNQSISFASQPLTHPEEKKFSFMFSSGLLGKYNARSGSIFGSAERIRRRKQTCRRGWFGILGRKSSSESKKSSHGNSDSFHGYMEGGIDASSVHNHHTHGDNDPPKRNEFPSENSKQENKESITCSVQGNNIINNPSLFKNSVKVLLKAPPSTLGASALALHYANIIVIVEKFVGYPHLIGADARVDLYNMLPYNIRASLRARLKPYAKNLTSSVYDPVLAEEWTYALTRIIQWLSPLAHSMIRWHSDRNFEQRNWVSRTHIFLLQTLYFANQEMTEVVITELLVGLNYVHRFMREIDAKRLQDVHSDCSSIISGIS